MKLSELDPGLLQRPDIRTGVSDRARALAARSLADLTPGDIAFCLRQCIALKHTVPAALALLAKNPFVDAGYYAGDLLLSLLHTSASHPMSTEQHRELWDICSDAAASLKTLQAEVLPEIEAFFRRGTST
jgi:hypothetical protein